MRRLEPVVIVVCCELLLQHSLLLHHVPVAQLAGQVEPGIVPRPVIIRARVQIFQRQVVATVSHETMGMFPGEVLIRHEPSWGYVLNSPWTVCASFPMERATDDASMSDASLDRSLHAWQWRQVDDYNNLVSPSSESDESSSSSEEEGGENE